MPKDKIKNKLNPYEDYFKIDEAPQNKFSIENYKAFISEQSIPLKKITDFCRTGAETIIIKCRLVIFIICK